MFEIDAAGSPAILRRNQPRRASWRRTISLMEGIMPGLYGFPQALGHAPADPAGQRLKTGTCRDRPGGTAEGLTAPTRFAR